MILADVDELLGVSHQRQHHRVAGDFERRQVLRIAQHDGRDADQSRLLDRFAQQRIRALAAFRRHEVVRTLEEAIVDFLGLDETADVDRAALFEGGRAEIFLRQDDEAAFLVLIALDELLPGDRLSFARADTLEAHG